MVDALFASMYIITPSARYLRHVKLPSNDFCTEVALLCKGTNLAIDVKRRSFSRARFSVIGELGPKTVIMAAIGN